MQISFFAFFKFYTKVYCPSCNLESKLLFYDHQNMSYDQSCTPTLLNLSAILFLAAILKRAEIEVARNHFGTCIIWRTYGVNFMLVSSTEVFPQICSLSSSATRNKQALVLSSKGELPGSRMFER